MVEPESYIKDAAFRSVLHFPCLLLYRILLSITHYLLLTICHRLVTMSDTSSESSSTHSSVTLASTTSNSHTIQDLTTAALATHALLESWYLEHVFLGDFQLLLMGRTKPTVKGVDVEIRKAGLLLGLKAMRMLFAKDQAEWDLDLIPGKDEKGFEVVHRPSGVVVRVFMRYVLLPHRRLVF